MFDAKYLRECLDYSHDTGVFTWRKRTSENFKNHKAWLMWNTRYAGQIAGCTKGDGYRLIGVDDRLYRAHRLAWLWMTGEWPKEHIDHINGDPSDNRFFNLREATRFDNMQNSRKPSTNTSGMKGVCWYKHVNKWHAQIRANGKKHNLGLFDCLELASLVVSEHREKLHGKFSRVA